MKIINKVPPALPVTKTSHTGKVSRTIIVDGREVVELVPVPDIDSNLRATDFSIQTLLEVNATELLRPCATLSQDRLTTADNVESAIESFVPEYKPEETKTE